MMAGRFDPEHTFNQPDLVALAVPASEVFGLFRRSVRLPSSWAALVTRTEGDRIVAAAGATVQQQDAEDILFVRTTPIDLAWEEETVVTGDQFQCRVEVSCGVALIIERGDLTSFLHTMVGSHRHVVADDLVHQLRPAARAALTSIASAHEAAALVDGAAEAQLSAALGDAFKASCFPAGLRVDGRPAAAFRSQTLRKVRRAEEDAARMRREHEASREVQAALESAQEDHLDHLASLLDRLKGLAAQSPDIALPELIRTFSEQERGELYEALFTTAQRSSKTEWIVVASGGELLFYDPENPARPARRVPVEAQAGPVRSIQTAMSAQGDAILLLGAQTGVYAFPVDQGEPSAIYLVPDAGDVRGGFNSAVLVGTRVYAAHSELGLQVWDKEHPDQPASLFSSMTQDADTVRDVRAWEDDLFCAIDDRVLRFADGREVPDAVYGGSSTAITSLLPAPGALLAGNSHGDVLRWSQDKTSSPEYLHRGSGRAVESLWLLGAHGVPRLVFVDTSLKVHTRVIGDNFSCGYEAGGQTLRRVEVAGDLLVATNDLRDRLMLWTPGQPQRPFTTLAVRQLTRHSIQDVCLISRA